MNQIYSVSAWHDKPSKKKKGFSKWAFGGWASNEEYAWPIQGLKTKQLSSIFYHDVTVTDPAHDDQTRTAPGSRRAMQETQCADSRPGMLSLNRGNQSTKSENESAHC